MKTTTRLRNLLSNETAILAPGVYDGISARLAEQAGAEVLYMTGAGVAASLGYPDFGLVTMTEMVERAGVIARTASVPLISDADTGYGNELNVTRTVREFEARGVAAIHIEDQVSPKRCGHLDGKQVVSTGDFVSLIRAAVHARRDPDFVLIARTDARAVNGFADAVDRVNAALDAGADVAFIEAPTTLEELQQIPSLVKGPCLLNLVPGGRTPMVSVLQAQQMGFRLVIMPGAAVIASLVSMDQALQTVMRTGVANDLPEGTRMAGMFARLGAAEWTALEKELLA